MDVDFLLRWDGALIDGDEALRRAPEIAEGVARPWDLEGRWRLRADGLGPAGELVWEDALVPLIGAVCLETVGPLARAGHAVASRLTEYGYLRLDAEGDWVRVGGDDLPSGRVEARPFVQAQLGCAGRLLALLTALGELGAWSAQAFELRALREDRRAAIEAYAGWPHDGQGPELLGPIPNAAPRREADGPVWLTREPGLTVRCADQQFNLPGDPDRSWQGGARGGRRWFRNPRTRRRKRTSLH